MPGWHAAAKAWREEHDLVLLGITQEQHPERCALFAQWQQFDWPILHDPINLVGSTAVPLVVAIDEHGIVRSTRPRPDSFEETFLNREFAAPDEAPPRLNSGPEHFQALNKDDFGETALDAMVIGDANVLWRSGSDSLTQAVKAYQRAVELDPEMGEGRFRLGVAQRMRFESEGPWESDFQDAVTNWQAALAIQPNQYIWRRRIQQYGPRLDKPYPFYDWVSQAREEIRARGEQPIELPVEPRGAELAQPARSFTAEVVSSEPVSDPKGEINRDEDTLIELKTVVVQGTGSAGKSYRIFLQFKPQQATHWNNEAEPMAVWLVPVDGVSVSQQAFSIVPPDQTESTETRAVEVEVLVESNEAAKTIHGYALYNVCEDQGGQCLFLRKDFEIKLP